MVILIVDAEYIENQQHISIRGTRSSHFVRPALFSIILLHSSSFSSANATLCSRPIYPHPSISVCFGILVFFYFYVSTWALQFFFLFAATTVGFRLPFWSCAFLWHIKPYGFDLPFYIFSSCSAMYVISSSTFFSLSFSPSRSLHCHVALVVVGSLILGAQAMYLSCIYCYIWNLVRFTLQCRTVKHSLSQCLFFRVVCVFFHTSSFSTIVLSFAHWCVFGAKKSEREKNDVVWEMGNFRGKR